MEFDPYDVAADAEAEKDFAAEAPNVTATRRRRWPIVLTGIIVILAGLAAMTASRWDYISAYFDSSLEKAVQTAGFSPVVSHQSGTSNSVESVEAKLGGCQLTFAWGVQPLDDGSSVVRLALIRDDGTFMWGPTPSKLGANTEFSLCF